MQAAIPDEYQRWSVRIESARFIHGPLTGMMRQDPEMLIRHNLHVLDKWLKADEVTPELHKV